MNRNRRKRQKKERILRKGQKRGERKEKGPWGANCCLALR
jgi:hypothetical protein